MYEFNPSTIWITGVTASGKTTLGKSLYEYLIGLFSKRNIEFLDGEELRKHLDKEYGYSAEDRMEVIKEIVQVVAEFNQQNKIVIVSTISHKRQMREFARCQLINFMEVFLKCPISVSASRDYKDHYRRAYAGEYEMFVGVTEPYEESESPELILDTENLSYEQCSQILNDKAIHFLDPAPRRRVTKHMLFIQSENKSNER
jgi:adenylylsulfate kinase